MSITRMKSGPRLCDVAEAAGVSMTTASVIVNGRADEYGIAQATRERVETLIRQFNYTPSLAARDMAAGRNRLLGLAVAADVPATDQLIATIQATVAEAGYRLMVTTLPSDSKTTATAMTDLMHAGIAGLIYCPPSTGSASIPNTDRPTISLGLPMTGIPSVYVDNRDAGRRLAQRLLDKGHRAIAILGAVSPQPPVVAGFVEACNRAGVTPRFCDSVGEFMALTGTATAAFCVTSATLLQLYCRVLGAGLRPGTHLAVVAVDNQGVAPHLVPRPVVLQPGTVQLGQAAARLIQQAIQGSAPGDTRFDPVISDGDSISTPPAAVRLQPSAPAPTLRIPEPVILTILAPLPVVAAPPPAETPSPIAESTTGTQEPPAIAEPEPVAEPEPAMSAKTPESGSPTSDSTPAPIQEPPAAPPPEPETQPPTDEPAPAPPVPTPEPPPAVIDEPVPVAATPMDAGCAW